MRDFSAYVDAARIRFDVHHGAAAEDLSFRFVTRARSLKSERRQSDGPVVGDHANVVAGIGRQLQIDGAGIRASANRRRRGLADADRAGIRRGFHRSADIEGIDAAGIRLGKYGAANSANLNAARIARRADARFDIADLDGPRIGLANDGPVDAFYAEVAGSARA